MLISPSGSDIGHICTLDSGGVLALHTYEFRASCIHCDHLCVEGQEPTPPGTEYALSKYRPKTRYPIGTYCAYEFRALCIHCDHLCVEGKDLPTVQRTDVSIIRPTKGYQHVTHRITSEVQAVVRRRAIKLFYVYVLRLSHELFDLIREGYSQDSFYWDEGE
jgi:hypothetical protein